MDNELIVEKNWWNRNWKWFLPTTLLLLLGVGLIFTSVIDGNAMDVAQAYSDNSLCEDAFKKAKTNERVIEALGDLEPIDKLAILEGNAKYSNNNNSVALTVRIKGSKGKGKMDIFADKNGGNWEYKNIKIRIKNTSEEIQVLKE